MTVFINKKIVFVAKNPSDPSVKFVIFNIYTHKNKHNRIEIFIGNSKLYNFIDVKDM